MIYRRLVNQAGVTFKIPGRTFGIVFALNTPKPGTTQSRIEVCFIAFYSHVYGYNVIVMKKIILHLVLILCIAVIPAQQAFPISPQGDMSAMDSMSTNCVNCSHHQKGDNSPCKNNGCMTQSINCSTASITLFLTESISTFDPVGTSSRLVVQYLSQYYSQIPKPEFRPPIA